MRNAAMALTRRRSGSGKFTVSLLVLYLAQVGLSDTGIGLLLTLMLIGDMLISRWITTCADQLGRRRTLVVGAGLNG